MMHVEVFDKTPGTDGTLCALDYKVAVLPRAGEYFWYTNHKYKVLFVEWSVGPDDKPRAVITVRRMTEEQIEEELENE